MTRTRLTLVAAALLVIAACSGDDDPGAASTTTSTTTSAATDNDGRDTTTSTTAGSALTSTTIAATGDAPFTLVDVTESAGVSFVHSTPFSEEDYTPAMSVAKMISGGAAADFDGDGDIDLFLLGGGLRADALFVNDGTGQFTDVAAEAGLADEMHLGSGAAVGDYDADGDLDLFVTSHGTPLDPEPGKHRLYRNDGGLRFTDVAAEAGVTTTAQDEADGFGAVFGDYDLDGDLDLFVAGWEKDAEGNRLFRNDGDGSFTDVTDEAGIVDEGIRGFSPCLVDTDGDHYPEILLVADFGTSRYFVNNRDGTFSERTVGSGVGLEWSGMGTAVGDFNGDSLIDWYVTAIFDDEAAGRGEGSKLYLNRGDHTFEDVTMDAGVADGGWGWGAVAADLDLDGDQDLVATNGWDFEGFEVYADELSKVWLNDGSAGFDEVTATVGLDHDYTGLSVLAFDYDGDGDDDIGITSPNNAFRLYRNDQAATGTWLRVLLDTSGATGLAPGGLGSRVRVTADGREQVREVAACSNYLSSVEPAAHFGLAGATTVDVVIEWADGTETILEGITPGRTLTVTP